MTPVYSLHFCTAVLSRFNELNDDDDDDVYNLHALLIFRHSYTLIHAHTEYRIQTVVKGTCERPKYHCDVHSVRRH